MFEFEKQSRRLEQEVAERSEWIEEVLSLDENRRRRLHRMIEEEWRSGPEMTELAEMIMVPVPGGEIRVLHLSPSAAGGTGPEAGGETARRPVLFVPGWGALPEEFQEFYDVIHGEVDLYFLETREKRSSNLDSGPWDMSVSRSARDIAEAVEYLGLSGRDYLLMGACWGSAIILEGLHLGILKPPTVVTVDPMKRLWFPRWALRFFFRWMPPELIALLKPLIVWVKLLKMEEPRQRERAEAFIRDADIRKWKGAAVAARNFQLAGKLASIADEVFVINSSDDTIHDQRYYPVITDRLPRGRFLSLQVGEKQRERMMGFAALAFARTRAEEGVPELFAEYVKLP